MRYQVPATGLSRQNSRDSQKQQQAQMGTEAATKAEAETETETEEHVQQGQHLSNSTRSGDSSSPTAGGDECPF